MGLFRKKRKPLKTVSPDSGDGGKLRYQVGNLQGVGRRANQEDSFTFVNALDEEQCDKFGLMFSVCDGMGGMKDGKAASESAIASLRAAFADMDRRGGIPQQLEDAVCSASRVIEDNLGGCGGSTTVTGVIIHEQLYFVSVGDSFLFLLRDGKLYRLNSEHNICHSLYLENIRDSSTETASCRSNAEAHALTQFLGMPRGLSSPDVSLRPLNLKCGDVIMACSDGVGGVLTEDEITDALMCPLPADKCKRIEEYIVKYAKPNQDNYTVVVVKCVN